MTMTGSPCMAKRLTDDIGAGDPTISRMRLKFLPLHGRDGKKSTASRNSPSVMGLWARVRSPRRAFDTFSKLRPSSETYMEVNRDVGTSKSVQSERSRSS